MTIVVNNRKRINLSNYCKVMYIGTLKLDHRYQEGKDNYK